MVKLPSEERGCNGKIDLGRSYQKAADRLAAKHKKQYGVYSCPYCGGTHLTTKLAKADEYRPLLYITNS
jgi:ribosomal protein L32